MAGAEARNVQTVFAFYWIEDGIPAPMGTFPTEAMWGNARMTSLCYCVLRRQCNSSVALDPSQTSLECTVTAVRARSFPAVMVRAADGIRREYAVVDRTGFPD